MSDSRGDFLAGLMVGGVLGLAVGVLFAPAAGDETRGTIRRRGSEVADRMRSSADNVGGRVREGLERAREGAGQLAEQVRSRMPAGGDAADGNANATTDAEAAPDPYGAPNPQPSGL